MMSVAALSFGMHQCGLERADRSLPRPAHHLFSFKRLAFSDIEEVKYRIARLRHYIWYSNVNIKR